MNQQGGPTPLGLMPGMEGRSPMDGAPLGYPGGPVSADMSRGLEDSDALATNVSPNDEGLPGRRLEELYNQYVTSKHAELAEMHKAELYYNGHHWSEEQLSVLRKRKQPPFYWNEIRKKVDSFIGIEQRLRRDPKAYPITPQHDVDASVVTAALRNIDDETNAKLVFSEAGRDYFVRGIGATWCGVYRTPKGEVKHCKRRVKGRSFVYDPRSTEWNFADAKYLGEYTVMDVEDAADLMMMLGEEASAKRVRGLVNQSMSPASDRDYEFSELNNIWWSRERQTVRLVHLYYRHRNKWRCAYFCGHIKLYDRPSVYQDEDGESVQPFHAASANVDADGTRYGVVRDLIPIQEVINQRYSKLTHMLATRQIVHSKGAVADINKTRQELVRPDGVIEVYVPGQRTIDNVFQVKTQDQEIRGNVELFSQALGMMQNYGPNSALLGKENSGQQSGRAILARQNAGMTEMSPIFDRHREFKLNSYKRDWALVRQFWTTEKWIRVTDDERGVRFAALNRILVDQYGRFAGVENDVANLNVDIVLEEGPDVIVMQEELLQTLSQVAGASPAMQKILITLSGVPNKDYLLQMIDQANAPPQTDPAQADMLQKAQMLELLEKASKIDQSIATADKSRAGAVVDMYKEGLSPALVGDQFPITYRQPTLTEGVLQQLMASMQPPAPQQQPMNALANDNGSVPPPQPLSRQGQQAMPGQAPQMNEPGGLPMGREFQG